MAELSSADQTRLLTMLGSIEELEAKVSRLEQSNEALVALGQENIALNAQVQEVQALAQRALSKTMRYEPLPAGPLALVPGPIQRNGIHDKNLEDVLAGKSVTSLTVRIKQHNGNFPVGHNYARFSFQQGQGGGSRRDLPQYIGYNYHTMQFMEVTVPFHGKSRVLTTEVSECLIDGEYQGMGNQNYYACELVGFCHEVEH